MGRALRGNPKMMMKLTSWIMVIFILVGVMYLFYWDYKTQALNLVHAFAASLWLNCLITMVMALRSRLLSHNKIPFVTALKANGLALTGLWVIPARLSEFVKPFYFEKFADYPKTAGFALTVKERVLDLFGFVVVAMLACGFVVIGQTMEASLQSDIMIQLLIVIGIFLTACVGMFLLPIMIKHISVLRRFEAFSNALRGDGFYNNTIQMILALVIWAGSVVLLCLFYIFSGLPDLSIPEMATVFVVSTLGLLVTVTPAGIGTHEAAVVGILHYYGVGLGDALAFAIAFRFCWMASPTAIGVYVLMKDGVNFVKGVQNAQR